MTPTTMAEGRTLRKVALQSEKQISSLVESRQTFSMDHCELNVFETRQQAELVPLQFDDMVLTSMLRGKKVMHVLDQPAFEYIPGQSVLLPPGEIMRIDFPEARFQNPTQCLALTIGRQQVEETLAMLNTRYPKEEADLEWVLNWQEYYLLNSEGLADTLNRVIRLATDGAKWKDVMMDLAMKELLIKLMQTQARSFIEKHYLELSNSHRFAAVLAYIRQNLHEKISIEKLARIACMSQPSFFRAFKREFGMTPLEYVIREKIGLAKDLLSKTKNTISDISYQCGFSQTNYFIRVFKLLEALTPKEFQRLHSGQ